MLLPNGSGRSEWKSLSLKRMCPLSASIQIAKKSWPSNVAVVSHICPFVTTGVDQPRCGIGVFHWTFRVSLQWSGRPIDSPGAAAQPFPCGPRNFGQSARAAVCNGAKNKRAVSKYLPTCCLVIIITGVQDTISRGRKQAICIRPLVVFTAVQADLLAEIQIWKTGTTDPFPESPPNAKTFYDV